MNPYRVYGLWAFSAIFSKPARPDRLRQGNHQAHERGVKIIGATAHYVTEDLDDGPIIEQTTVHVSHRDEVSDLIRKGRDTERLALARALRLHLRRQVMVYRGRTAVFA